MQKIKYLPILINLYLNEIKYNQMLDNIPNGYISKKVISKKVYHYRQWRGDDKIFSEYVPEDLLPLVENEISIRRKLEELLKTIKNEIKRVGKNAARIGLISDQDLDNLDKYFLEAKNKKSSYEDIKKEVHEKYSSFLS